MTITSGYGNNVCPTAYVTPLVFVSNSNNRAVGFQSDCMTITSGYGNNVCPTAYVTLSIIVITDSNHRAVGLQTNCMISPNRDGNNVFPTAYVTLPLTIVSDSKHRAVGFQPYRMKKSGRDIFSYGNLIPERKTSLFGIAVPACCAKRHCGMDIIALGEQGLCLFILNRWDNQLGCKQKRCKSCRNY